MILVRNDELVLEVALQEDALVMWRSEEQCPPRCVNAKTVSPVFGALQLQVYGVFIVSLECI